jgi:chromosome segregation ATPase
VGLVALASVLIRVGQERQSRIDLERRHDELAKEFRDAKSSNEGHTTRLTELEKDNVETETEIKNIQHRMQDIKNEKASVESVEALRETLGRIDGTVMEMARRLDTIADKILKDG